ncbi:MAG: hypothetical protein HYY93_01465 [Planctomycetes bacterium]|nr:hypothetical protein [Planctomycetota bacterium]
MNLKTCLTAAIAIALLGAASSTAQQGKRDRPQEGALKVGDSAPDFELKQLPAPDARKTDEPVKVKLSSFQGKKPVVLIFGSYT